MQKERGKSFIIQLYKKWHLIKNQKVEIYHSISEISQKIILMFSNFREKILFLETNPIRYDKTASKISNVTGECSTISNTIKPVLEIINTHGSSVLKENID